MPPQIEKIHPGDETETIEQTISVEQKENTINIQKYLLTLIFIQWIVFAITLTFGLYSVLTGNTTTISSGIQSLIPIIILVIYYTFGLLVAYKLHRVGLLFFACIGVVLFIGICIFIGYLLLVVIALADGFGGTSQTYELIVFLGLLFIAVAIVAIMTLKFSFDLAKSIERHDYSTV